MIPYVPAYADVAVSYRLPAQIEQVQDPKLRQSSVLLGKPPASPQPISALMESAAAYVRAIAVLPADPEADRRIEELISAQPRRGTRRPLRRK